MQEVTPGLELHFIKQTCPLQSHAALKQKGHQLSTEGSVVTWDCIQKVNATLTGVTGFSQGLPPAISLPM